MDVNAKQGGAASHLFSEAKALRSQLGDGPTKTKLTIFAGDTDEEAARFVVVINSPTVDEAYGHAEELRKALGCNCVSSGETEITCTCPD